jgi:D-alanine-D-alanine ligase
MAKKPLCIAVLMGGPSSEHEVSLKSGEMVFTHVDRSKYEPVRVVIQKNGEWTIPPEEIKKFSDCAFIAMHGTYGEDGTVQGILELHKIPYTGSDSLSSALGMNKFLSLQVFREGGLRTAPSLLIHRLEWRTSPTDILKKIKQHIGLPVVVKPNNQGSSFGVSIVKNEKKLEEALRDAFDFSREVITEKFIEGREITCGVLDHGWSESAFPLLPTEIIPRGGTFFDYKAKYEKNGSYEITPPQNIAPQMIEKLRRAALTAHKLIGARGISRTDMILDKKGDIYVLEINTIPGLTEESLIPKAAMVHGIEFPKLLSIIIDSALHKHGKRGI